MTDQQELIVLTMLFKPLGLLLILLIALPFKLAAQRLPDGRLRRFLLFRVSDSSNYRRKRGSIRDVPPGS